MSISIKQTHLEYLRVCSCGRPKPFGHSTKCELCKHLGLESAPTPDQYRWLENSTVAAALNPQVKLLGWSSEKQVCLNCVHFKKIDHQNRSRYERWRTICGNYISDKAFKPYWPACHNFQPRPAKKERKQKVSA